MFFLIQIQNTTSKKVLRENYLSELNISKL